MKSNFLSATEIIKNIIEKKFTVEQVCIDHNEHIQKYDPSIKAWSHFDANIVLDNAKAIDIKIDKGQIKLLAGIPIGIKDVFNTKDFPTEMGSEVWKGFMPGNDARTVFDLRENDAIIMGKTVTAEFAVHYLPEDKTINPLEPLRITGTSSSGSAAAVAAYMVPIALGTQTGGSIVRPASYCGVIGFKPTFGIIPRTGVLKTSDTLDTVGLIARTIQDIRLVFDVMRVKGPNYPFVNKYLKEYSINKKREIKVGYILDQLSVQDNLVDYSINAFLDYLNELKSINNINIIKILKLEKLNSVHKTHKTIYDKTLSYYFKQEFKFKNNISENILRLIENGNVVSKDEYISSLEKQSELREYFNTKFDNYDLIITTATTGEAPKRGEEELDDSCLIWSFLGMPVLSLPIFKGPNGLPFSLQIIAKRYDDYKLLTIASHLLSQIKKFPLYLTPERYL